MKNLFNCHCLGLHSFPISFENNLLNWPPKGLYIEVGNDVKEQYTGKYKHLI